MDEPLHFRFPSFTRAEGKAAAETSWVFLIKQEENWVRQLYADFNVQAGEVTSGHKICPWKRITCVQTGRKTGREWAEAIEFRIGCRLWEHNLMSQDGRKIKFPFLLCHIMRSSSCCVDINTEAVEAGGDRTDMVRRKLFLSKYKVKQMRSSAIHLHPSRFCFYWVPFGLSME